MAKTFTKQGAINIQMEFKALCEKFAKDHDLELDRNHMTWGTELVFKTTMSIPENKNEAWNDTVSYFSSMGANLHVGAVVNNGRKSYTVTGKLNPANSKYKIGAKENKLGGKDTYFTIDGMISMLKK